MRKVDLKRQIIFGRNITRIRREKSLSQDDLAARCRLTKSSISVIENGNRNFSFSTLMALAKALKVHPKELLDLNFELDQEEF